VGVRDADLQEPGAHPHGAVELAEVWILLLIAAEDLGDGQLLLDLRRVGIWGIDWAQPTPRRKIARLRQGFEGLCP
jgi:hypothetical protein